MTLKLDATLLCYLLSAGQPAEGSSAQDFNPGLSFAWDGLRGSKLLRYGAKRLMSIFMDKEKTAASILLFVREGGH